MEKLTKKGLDGTQLKTIALVLMVLDHIHYFFEFTGCIPTVFSMLGRLSAPLFLFCTVEALPIPMTAGGILSASGYRRSHGGAGIFYDLRQGLPARGWLLPQNAIFQDFVLLCIVWQGIDWLREKNSQRALAPLPPFCAGRMWW